MRLPSTLRRIIANPSLKIGIKEFEPLNGWWSGVWIQFFSKIYPPWLLHWSAAADWSLEDQSGKLREVSVPGLESTFVERLRRAGHLANRGWATDSLLHSTFPNYIIYSFLQIHTLLLSPPPIQNKTKTFIEAGTIRSHHPRYLFYFNIWHQNPQGGHIWNSSFPGPLQKFRRNKSRTIRGTNTPPPPPVCIFNKHPR